MKNIQHHHTIDELETHLNKIFNLMRLYDKDFKYGFTQKTNNCFTNFRLAKPYQNRLYEPIFVQIGIKDILNNCDGEYVYDNDFIDAICSTYHELGHIILRTTEFMRDKPKNINIRHAAEVSAISHFFDEYRKIGYPNSPEEIMCEIFAFKCLEKHFEQNPVNIDWKNIAIENINNYPFMADKQDKPVKRTIDSYENMIKAYETKLQTVFDERKRIQKKIFKNKIHSQTFYELLANDVLPYVVDKNNIKSNNNKILTYIVDKNCTGAEEVKILTSFISKNYPEFFKGYRCLESIYDITYPIDYQTSYPGNTFGEPRDTENREISLEQQELESYFDISPQQTEVNNTVSKTNAQQTLKSKNAQQTSNNKLLNSQSTPKSIGSPTVNNAPKSPGTYSNDKPMPVYVTEPQNEDNDDFEID